MFIAVIGNDDITKSFADSLLRDLIKSVGYAYVVFPEQETDPTGLANTYNVCCQLEYEQLIWLSTIDDFKEDFVNVEDEEKILLVLGTTEVEPEIELCHENNIPVLDLTKALFPV